MSTKTAAGYASDDLPQNKGYPFSAKQPVIPGLSIYSEIRLLTLGHPKKIAVDCLDLQVSYQQMLKDAVTVSKALKTLHVGAGDIVSVCMPNCYQAIVIFLACNRIGAVVTFLRDEASADELCSYLEFYHSPAFFNCGQTAEDNLTLKARTSVKQIITLNKEQLSDPDLMKPLTASAIQSGLIDFHSLGQLAKGHAKGRAVNRGSADAVILYTSGTTGEPKPVVLTNRNIMSAGVYLKNSSSLQTLPVDRCLVCVPFSYPYGLVPSALMTLLSGKTAILAPNLSADNIQASLEKKPNMIFGSPALLELMMRNVREDLDLSCVRSFISGGDFLTVKHCERGRAFFRRHGAPDVELVHK